MLIAILSDSHDHITNMRRAVDAANKAQAQVLIHCGDLISPFMLIRLEQFHGPVHLIYGNNVGDQHLISSRCQGTNNIQHHGITGKIIIDSMHIGFNHYPDLARAMAEGGKFDIVCCGHNHICSMDEIGDCLLVNPGDLLGKDDPPGFLLLDTKTREAQRIIVGNLMDEHAPFQTQTNKIEINS